ncbi:MAG: amidoligase family protein [Deltaproteobacteria bacterium]|nr:amidoligase family protein [Deltaproteobacteria bacterium]MBW2620321.1 amidoligase family protein [Deltaproteobacteria bacterium]MBW2643031.1 amidoligase family protein [Deltaproteobacteria bacterium]
MTVSDHFVTEIKNKYPMLQNFTDRTFGVEIEFFGLNYVITPLDNSIIKPYCISSRAKDGRHITDLYKDYNLVLGASRDLWHFERDSSVRGKGHTKCGVELISPILSGMEGLVQVFNAFRFLNAIEGIDIDASCGMHVHHGVDPAVYTCKELQQLVRIVHHYEDLFYLLIPGDRKNVATCRPMEIDVKAFLDVCEGNVGDGNCHIKELWYSLKNRYDANGGVNSRYDKTRYHGLNLHSYWYRSTIEFRYHSSVLHDIDGAMQWIIFTQFIVELSQGYVPEIYYYPEANKWLKTIYEIYTEYGYKERIKQAPTKADQSVEHIKLFN